jgi:hypothetical protein
MWASRTFLTFLVVKWLLFSSDTDGKSKGLDRKETDVPERKQLDVPFNATVGVVEYLLGASFQLFFLRLPLALCFLFDIPLLLLSVSLRY